MATRIVEGRLNMRDQVAAAEYCGYLERVMAEVAQDPSAVRGARERVGFDLVNAIEISHEGNDVVARVEVPQRNVEALVDMIAEGIEEKLR